MKLNEEKVIKKTIELLDSSVDYSNYDQSDNVNTYLDYITKSHNDEESLMDPLFLSFLEEILGFTLGKTLRTKENISGKGDYPDYFPVDTRTHAFLFDAKGTNTRNLSEHYSQIERYMERHPSNINHGILSNMRDLAVYTLNSSNLVARYSFSFRKMYKDNRDKNITAVKKERNTRKFLDFVKKFSYRELSIDQKFQKVKKGGPWTGEEELDVKLLVNTLDSVVSDLHEDTRKSRSTLENIVESNPERAKKIAQELEYIASQSSEDYEAKEATENTLLEALNRGSEGDLYYRSLDTLFLRTAYFTMTKLLLVRMWEDIEFIDQTLYDGGLEDWYQQCNQELKRVLSNAFYLAGEKYQWLFKAENNYTWYTPSDKALINVLYKLSNFNLGKLDRDVLGTVYEDYIDEVDKKNKGQYYTPREIVSFIWDQVSFQNTKAYFNQRKGKREPARIFDPASGSGGFLVEAARRIREDSNLDLDDKDNLKEIRTSIVSGLFGSEISIFPYYITEVNLLIQLTPVIKRILELQPAYSEHLPLPVVQTDSLSLHNPWNHFFDDQEEPQFDEEGSVMRFVSGKKSIWKKIKEGLAGDFDYCCANPPYVGEKGHKELFRETKERTPYWEDYYQGKMDYFYWFVILGISKLKEGGKLGFITTSYWPTADGASKLRSYILQNTKIKKMIFFEDLKIFEHAKGQHNLVFVLEKQSGEDKKSLRSENKIKVVRVLADHNEIPGEDIRSKIKFTTDRISEHIEEDHYKDEYIKVFRGDRKQGELDDPKEGPPINGLIAPETGIDYSQSIVPLEGVLEPKQGIVPNPDEVTARNIKHISNQSNIKEGDGVFVLTKPEVQNLNCEPDEEELIKLTYRNSEITEYFVDRDEDLFLIYITKEHDIQNYPNIERHLRQYKEILERRREVKQGSIPWYSLHWPRKQNLFENSKIVCSNWGNDWQPFAYQEKGFYERRDITLFRKKDNIQESLFYLLGILNSSVIKEWAKQRMKQRGYMQQGLQKGIPLYRINFSSPAERELHDNITKKVKSIREKKKSVSQYSKYFLEDKLTHLESDASLPSVDPLEIIGTLVPENIYSIRTHPNISILRPKDERDNVSYLRDIGKIEQTLQGPQVQLNFDDQLEIKLQGPKGLLKVLIAALKECKGKSWNTVKKKAIVPKHTDIFDKQKEELTSKVKTRQDEIAKLQNDINQSVKSCYGLD